MPGAATQRSILDSGLGSAAHSKLARKIALLAGTDDFADSRSGTLLSVLSELAREVVIIAPHCMRAKLEERGANVFAFNCRATMTNPARDAVSAWKLARILEAENADVVHAVGAKACVLCGLALKLVTGTRTLVHLPDIDALRPAASALPRFYSRSPAKVIAGLVRSPSSFLLVESADDMAELRASDIDPGARVAVASGPGIDPDNYPLLPPAHGEMPVAACVTRMAAGSGVDVLVQAFDRLWSRGVCVQLELAGEHTQAADAIPDSEIARWDSHPGVRRTTPVGDVREVWRQAEICVVPAVTRQGLPRAVLEAAACGRALIVTENAGGGFVRHDVEGLVVPAGDIAALAAALERVARDPELRQRLGHAARLRILQGYTEAHVRQTLKGAYLTMLDAPGRHRGDGLSAMHTR